LLAGAAVLAALGISIVRVAGGQSPDAQTALTFLVIALAFGSLHLAFRQWAANASPYLLPLTAILTAVGLVEIFRLDPSAAGLQRWWLLVAAGISVLVLFLLRDEGVEALRRYRYLFLAAAVVLLLLPLLPTSWPIHGAIVNGSRLWVRFEMPFGGRTLSFQPGEIAKVFLAIFLASYLAERHTAMAAADRTLGPLRIPPLREFGPVVIAALASFGVLVYQRDLGASLLLFALFIGLIYIATGRAAYVGVGAILIAVGGLFAYQMFDHVQRRVEAWLRPFDDFTGSGFQIAQSLFALGSGSLTGSGLGLGEPNRIPFASTDFIFAAIGEEMGYAGTIAVLAGFALLTAAGFGIALRARDVFRKFLAAALTLLLAVQAILILGGVLRVMPVTGITLPFMSYGGSALLTNLVMITLLARISHGERS